VEIQARPDDIRPLRACINDLVSVLTLPAIWSGYEPSQIGRTLLDAVLGLLRLDFAYLRLGDSLGGGAPIELIQVAQRRNSGAQPEEVGRALNDWLADDPSTAPVLVPNPVGEGKVAIALRRLGLQEQLAILVAGSARADFPTTTERLVLDVAVNQAVIALQEARLLSEQRRVARELDQRVEQRTRELAVANEELRAAFDEIKTLKDQLHNENIALREEINHVAMFEEIIGSSEALRNVLTQVSKVAPADTTVLILGETGTGKELIARAIHKRSKRAARAFIGVNCAAIPRDLVASELFGHEKGAFTGATQQRLGRFELASGGTIFLDEVGELPAETQITLLRVLQEHEFERVGGTRQIRADVRVIAATNRDLETAIADKGFRSDLYYRLNVFPIVVPPLRERREDIPLLVEYFVHRFAMREGKAIRSIRKKTLDLLESYDWPGNIRELQNVVERTVLVSESEALQVDERWLFRRQSKACVNAASPPEPRTLAASEKDAIEAALMGSRGRVSGPFGAARRLGLPSSTLESKIKALKVDKDRFKQ
jgi:transcriptional regulator with GAF, ATPase, and Fis domain